MKKIIVLFFALVTTFAACTSTSTSDPNKFNSEQEVIDFCRGKSFYIPMLGNHSTNNESDIYVQSYSANTATVRIAFPFAGDKLEAKFRVNKETGESEWFR